MSCGGHILSGFTCGARRFDKYKFTTDKPSNPVLHTENQNKLNELLRLREEQDKGIFQPLPISSSMSSPMSSPMVVSPITPVLADTTCTYYPLSDVSYKCKKD